jgi:hypothetical protein
MIENAQNVPLVIVCKTAEARIIENIIQQLGVQVRGIITQDDLIQWYALCQTKYSENLGKSLLLMLQNQFEQEFPLLNTIEPFMIQRNYDSLVLEGIWIMS